MYNKALLIYNGNAGQGETENIFEEIIPLLSKEINNLMLSQTKKEGDAEIIAKNTGENYELIISLGGDGTLHEIINGIAELENPPIVGIIPTGTLNDFARSLNIPLNLRDSVNTILKGGTASINIGQVNNRYFTNFVGIGLITDIAENINSDVKDIMGKISYYTSTIKSIGEKEDFEFTLKTESQKITDKAGMIVILNGNYAGSTLVPVKNVDLQDDLFDVFIVYEAGFSLLMKYLTQKDNFKDRVTEDEILHIQAKEIKIETKKEMQIDTDGEIYLKTPADIKVLNRKYEFIVGD